MVIILLIRKKYAIVIYNMCLFFKLFEYIIAFCPLPFYKRDETRKNLPAVNSDKNRRFHKK